MRARRPRSQGMTFRTQTGAAVTRRTSTPSSGMPTPLARTDSTSIESVDLMVVTAISVAFGHARTASISRSMPRASFPSVYSSLATWCTAPISRILLAVEAMRLVKKDPLGARASRPHKAWHSDAYLPHFNQPGTAPFRVDCVKDVPGLYRSFSVLGGNLFFPPDLWPIPLELSPTPSWPFVRPKMGNRPFPYSTSL